MYKVNDVPTFGMHIEVNKAMINLLTETHSKAKT